MQFSCSKPNDISWDVYKQKCETDVNNILSVCKFDENNNKYYRNTDKSYPY